MRIALWLIPVMLIGVPSMSPADEAKPAPSGGRPRLRAVPFTEVKVDDAFWAPRIETNRTVTIPHDFAMCERTGRIANFARAAGLERGKFQGIFYDDSDVYKVIEGASYSLAARPDPELDKYLDALIARVAAAQQTDGYLFTFYTVNGTPEKRWTNLKDMHELYCAGHLIEAAVAHHRATGKRPLLDVATRLADHIDSVFGPAEQGKRPGTCGHEEVELALVKLADVTGHEKYAKLARFFIDMRGNEAARGTVWGPYHQDHELLKDQAEPVGHAVRAMYLYAGAADVMAALGARDYDPALRAIWDNLTGKKMYVTGGIGARHDGEAFGDEYELPNESAYNETCAAVGMALWNSRMNLLHADAKYADVMERVLYNAFLTGVSLKGDTFFYVNPLASAGHHHRQAWYSTACCPVNVVRFLPSLPGYLYAASTATVPVKGANVALRQETGYPWDGKVVLRVDPDQPTRFALKLRIPAWCDDWGVKVNGADAKAEAAGYLTLDRQWAKGDTVELDLAMPVKRVKADPRVKANVGRVAVQRGPVVYCVEAVDHGGRVSNLALPPGTELTPEHRSDLLGGVTVLKGKAVARTVEGATEAADLLAIPYYAWDHRAPGEMAVWLPEDPKLAVPPPAPTIANTSKPSASHVNPSDTVQAMNDDRLPKDSADHAIPRFTWWDRRGTAEWVQYDFDTPHKVSAVEVYWFDDEPRGGRCRAPADWQLLYRDGDDWKPVKATGPYGTAKEAFNQVTFDRVETSALRVRVQLRKGFSGGILEWRVGDGPEKPH